jgi:Leucine-rich repeat (LRR) protein
VKKQWSFSSEWFWFFGILEVTLIILRLPSIFILVLGCASVIAQPTNLDCAYQIFPYSGDYECVISQIELVDDESQSLTITGNHLENKTNADVQVFRVTDANVPFVITQAFLTFPNLEQYVAISSGLKRVQSNAIRNAPRLFNFLAHMNANMTTVHEFAFSGGSGLTSVNLQVGSITDVRPNAFVGLTNLRILGLQNNRITKFPKNMLRPLPRLQTVFFSGNLLEVLDADLFAFNPRMHQIGLMNNRINAIHRNFLAPIPFTNFLFLQGNLCIDFNVLFGWQSEAEIQRRLQPCFENFDQQRLE